ncbi:MAG: YbaN family protein [Lautropia sp.]|nr:YbaN family protein [Lautropia sp.]
MNRGGSGENRATGAVVMKQGWRWLLQGVGLLALLLGLAGIPLPGLPTTPFLLLAACCFARANPAWEQRLLAHPRTGPILRAWRERRAIPRRAKWVASLSLAASAISSWLLIRQPLAHVIVIITLVAALWIWTRPDAGLAAQPAAKDQPGA